MSQVVKANISKAGLFQHVLERSTLDAVYAGEVAIPIGEDPFRESLPNGSCYADLYCFIRPLFGSNGEYCAVGGWKFTNCIICSSFGVILMCEPEVDGSFILRHLSLS